MTLMASELHQCRRLLRAIRGHLEEVLHSLPQRVDQQKCLTVARTLRPSVWRSHQASARFPYADLSADDELQHLLDLEVADRLHLVLLGVGQTGMGHGTRVAPVIHEMLSILDRHERSIARLVAPRLVVSS